MSLVAGAVCTDAGASCRQALALGLDVSGSVDATEYRLQLDGLAAALNDPSVTEALFTAPEVPVLLSVFEWSGTTDQRLLVDWTAIDSVAALSRVTARLRSTRRAAMAPVTALGSAALYGATLLQGQPTCWKRTLDLSGDGKANAGPRPRDVKGAAVLSGTTVNALVIGADNRTATDQGQGTIAELSAYFTAEVIQGPDAFIITALGFQDFQAAMTRKLRKELQGRSFTELTPPHGPTQ
ncbi:DUF1194 domain-containing protein [Pseudogemmobacter sp. W21_MBD1_M6]|uniref:DUF1194 domain-containing protein n=1 Tax=Pseudogemmobacter sp. W21_MBD1_M6 TaxID=3240271 RepID=UPI003F9E5043